MSFEALRIVFSLVEVGVFRKATAGGGDIHVFSTLASYPRPRVAWATDTGELEPVDNAEKDMVPE